MLVLVTAAGCTYWSEVFGEQRTENALLAAMYRGQPRAEFYRIAKSLGATPRNRERRLSDGTPWDLEDFPLHDASHPHPTVWMSFSKSDGLLLWHFDTVTVEFDEADCVRSWTAVTQLTGS